MRHGPLAVFALLVMACDGSSEKATASAPDATLADAMDAGDAGVATPADADADVDAFCKPCPRSLEAGCSDGDGGWSCPRDYGEWCAATHRGGFYWGCNNDFIAAPYDHGTDCISLYAFDPVSLKLIALINDCNGAGCTNGDPSLCIAFCCGPPTFCPAGVGAPCPVAAGDH